MSRRLPRGRVTFAFVDVVESTRTFTEHGEAFVAALAALQARVARHTRAAGGEVVKTEGDGAFLAFPSAMAAIEALVGLQDELAQLSAEPAPRLSVRAGTHTGDAVPVADDYVSLAVNVAARVTSAAGAGQLVVSATTQAELSSPSGVSVGEYDLKDVADPMELWLVCGDDSPLRATPSRRTNVAVPVAGFVGREEELVELGDLVGTQRLVTVLGPGGLGKTRLVSELVLAGAGGIEGGAWLVELASLSTGDQVPGAVGQVLGAHGGEVDALAAELQRRGEVLLVLDNCEHLLDAVADLVSQLHETCPRLTLLCTSREALQVPGEHVWRLRPLAGQAARFELFTQRAWASGAVVRDDSTELVDRLCTALDGLPLAIELAATQSGSTTLEDLVQIAEGGTDDLARRGGEPRQRNLDAVLAWSLDRLPPTRRSSLLALSILPGRFDAEMATALLGASDGCEIEAVRPLARASLIDHDGESYRILDTIRHAARRRLTDDPELAVAARLGLRAWALDLGARWYRVPGLHSDVPPDTLLALETALEHAMDDAASGIGQLWELVRAVSFYREPSDRVVALANRVLSGDVPADADEALCFASALSILRMVGPMNVPEARLEAICAAADQHGASFAAATLHYGLVFDYARRGDVAAARRHADAYLPYAESPAAQAVERRAVHTLRGCVAYAAGDYEQALIHAERDLAEAKASGSVVDLESSEANVADGLLDLDRPAEALPHAVEAIRLCPGTGPQRRNMLSLLLRAQAELGDNEAALETARQIEAEMLASGRPTVALQAELDELRPVIAALSKARARNARR